jgi:hypothetical protein
VTGATQCRRPGGKHGDVVLASSAPPSPWPAARRLCSSGGWSAHPRVRWPAPPFSGLLLRRVVAAAWSSRSGCGPQGYARRRPKLGSPSSRSSSRSGCGPPSDGATRRLGGYLRAVGGGRRPLRRREAAGDGLSGGGERRPVRPGEEGKVGCGERRR